MYTCSNIKANIVEQTQLATWTQQRFMMGSTVGEVLWEQPLILHVSPTASSVVHQATCYQCTSSWYCNLLCDPWKTCEHSLVLPLNIQRHLTGPHAESILFIPHEWISAEEPLIRRQFCCSTDPCWTVSWGNKHSWLLWNFFFGCSSV